MDEDGAKGLLVRRGNNPDEVDLFLINHEEASLSNDITGENISDFKHLDEHIEMHPGEVTIEGKLLPSKYGGKRGGSKGDDILRGQKKAHEKLTKIKNFCNDVRPGTYYNFHAPALPLTFTHYYPTDFSYSNEGESNAIIFNLTLEEIGMRKELKRGGQNAGGGGTNALQGKKSWHASGDSRYHTSIASPSEDGGGQVERGIPAKKNLNSIIRIDSLEDKVEENDISLTSAGVSVPEVINKLIGVEESLSERITMLKLEGRAESTVSETFEVSEIQGDLGRGLSQIFDGASFPSANRITDKKLTRKQIVENIPVIGGLLEEARSLPSESEFFVEATRKQDSTILMSMRSPSLRKIKKYLINQGSDQPVSTRDRMHNVTTLSDRENRILKDSFVEGIGILRNRVGDLEGLHNFVSQLPPESKETSLTYYNYYGQPVVSFENIIDLDFTRWATQTIELNGNDYELETYWNKAGFPVISMKQDDGTKMIQQERAFLGSDILGSLQSVPALKGVHIIPFSITDDIHTIEQGEIGSTVFFMVVHTNDKRLEEVM